MRKISALLVVCACACASSCRQPIPPAPERDLIAATVDAFHEALAKGDTHAATDLLADDVQVLENGERQNRTQYLEQHLPADIAFAKTVPTTYTALLVREESDVAWTTATYRSSGRFNSRDVQSEGAELMVLAKAPGGWRIRAIHWSGQPHR